MAKVEVKSVSGRHYDHFSILSSSTFLLVGLFFKKKQKEKEENKLLLILFKLERSPPLPPSKSLSMPTVSLSLPLIRADATTKVETLPLRRRMMTTRWNLLLMR